MSWLKCVGGALALGFFAIALAGQSQVLFRDKDSNVTISNYKSFNLKRLANDKTRVTATGSPIVADWSRQELSMRAPRIVAIVSQGRTAQLELESVDLSGQVNVAAKRASASKQAGQLQTVELTSIGAEYRSENNRVTLSSDVVIDRNDPGAGQTTVITAGSGWAELYRNPMPKTALSAIKDATLRGGVTLKLTSRKTENGKVVQSYVNGKCSTLTFDDAARRYVLSGNVSIDGNDAILFGKISGNQVVITLDAAGQVDEIEVTGDPSTSEVARGGKPPHSRTSL